MMEFRATSGRPRPKPLKVGCVENLGELITGRATNIFRPAVAFDIVYVSICLHLCTKVISLFHGIESHVFTQISE